MGFSGGILQWSLCILLSHDAQLPSGLALDMAGKWILHLKSEVLDTIRHYMLSILKYSSIIALKFTLRMYHELLFCVFFSLMQIMIVMWIYGFWVVELMESWLFNIICCNHCHKYHFRKLSSWENARVFSNLGFFSGYYEEDVRGTIFFK